MLPVESMPRYNANPRMLDLPSIPVFADADSDEQVAARTPLGRMVASSIPLSMRPMSAFFMVLHPTPRNHIINIILLIY